MPIPSKCFTSMPAEVRLSIQQIGDRVRVARLRRNWTIKDLASRVGVTSMTISRLEKGDPAVAIGILVTAVWTLGLADEFKEFLAPEHDEVGRGLEARRNKQRARSKKTEQENLDF